MGKKPNIGKKTLTAMGAVVAAGLTPGMISGAPNNAEITAADVVAIDGRTYGFDELLAMQRGDTADTVIELPDIILQDNKSTLYGAPVIIQPYKRKKDTKDDGNAIYRSVEQMPQFPGGEAALMKYIQQKLKYPQGQEDIEGDVMLQFVVKKNGKVGVVKVVRTLGNDFDKEAIRVIKSLPKFTPGRQNGKAVNVWYTLPVPFKLPAVKKN